MGAAPNASGWARAMPAVFVLLWSTGFVGAKLGLPYAEPYTFLAVRMAIAAGLLLVFALATGAPWPRDGLTVARIAVAGLLVHAIYLGGVFSAIAGGLSAGVAALIVGLQPLLTAAGAGLLLGERVAPRQWLGLVLGLAGVGLVVTPRLVDAQASGAGLVAVLAALLAITAGTLYQKRHCADMDLRSGGVIQYAATALAMGALALLFEQRDIQWTGEFVFALVWLILVLSVGAVGLLYTLIRHGAAARVASLFYLVPPVTGLLAYLLFDERLTPLALAGMVVVMAGVYLVNTTGRPKD